MAQRKFSRALSLDKGLASSSSSSSSNSTKKLYPTNDKNDLIGSLKNSYENVFTKTKVSSTNVKTSITHLSQVKESNSQDEDYDDFQLNDVRYKKQYDSENTLQKKSSSATELISRRGVFSRRHYGSVDQLPQSDIDVLDPNSRRFRLENGESLAEIDEVFGSPSIPILENPEYQTRWYFKFFLGKLHQNYVGIDSEKNPYFFSIVSQDSGNKCMPLLRAILFRKQGAQKISLPYNPSQKLTVKQLLAHFPAMDSIKTPKELFSADIQKDLLLLEEQEGSVNFKFGVIYMKYGQRCDDEMLSNEFGSKNFDDFLSILGEKITLKGWERFRGGLDVKGDMTGKYSIYTLYEGHEIMFHVSTLLPFSRDNRQQVERKRHIGNDIINIVYIDCDSNTSSSSNSNTNSTENYEFSPNSIKSQFTHVFAVVTKNSNTYKLAIYCDETVPPFGPTLPNPPEFQDETLFREFLLVKLINGEKATFQTPTFSRKRTRTLEMLIKDLYDEYVHDTKLTMLNRRAFSEVLYDAPKTSKLKEDARQVEFVRIGQALKLEAIVRGDAPTSLASTGPGSVFKRPPWEPQCFYAAFYQKGCIIGDSFGNDGIFLSVDEGTFLVKEDQSYQMVFDKTLSVKQMSVIEEHGILLLRGGLATNKDGHKIHLFKLNEFKVDPIRVRSRLDVKDRRIDKTRGCHLYATSKSTDVYLRIVIAIGKKLLVYQWKYTAAWTSWCSNNSDTLDSTEGFIFIKEISLHDLPTLITILEKPPDTNSSYLFCIGFKHHFEIVCEQSGSCTKLHDTETTQKRTQIQLVAALDLCDGQETELLLCYNHTCHFQKLYDDIKSTEFDFHWNTSPTSIVCAFPYIIAFTGDSIEIRLLVNGNLVHTVTMTDLQLITCKKDIYFATTAPEFITKDIHVKPFDNEQQMESSSAGTASLSANPLSNPNTAKNQQDINITNNTNEYSNERIFEIKHKIEKTTDQTFDDGSNNSNNNNNNNTNTDTNSSIDTDNVIDNEKNVQINQNNFIINAEDNLTKFLPIPSSTINTIDHHYQHPPFIQRARSLQKPKTKQNSDDLKRLISKSNSCGDSYVPSSSVNSEFSPIKQSHQLTTLSTPMTSIDNKEPIVPPNSPKTNTNTPGTPTQGFLLRHNQNNKQNDQLESNSGNSNPSGGGTGGTNEKIKPVRIFRIPLANLSGTHSHYHSHNSNKVSKLKTNNINNNNNNRITEDHLLETNEDSQIDNNNDVDGNTDKIIVKEPDDNDQCDNVDLLKDTDNDSNNAIIPCDCTNLSLSTL